MNRRELIMMAAAIPIGAAAAAKPQTVLFIGDTMIKPLQPLNVCGGGFLVPKEMSDEIMRLMAIPPELIDKGEE